VRQDVLECGRDVAGHHQFALDIADIEGAGHDPGHAQDADNPRQKKRRDRSESEFGIMQTLSCELVGHACGESSTVTARNRPLAVPLEPGGASPDVDGAVLSRHG